VLNVIQVTHGGAVYHLRVANALGIQAPVLGADAIARSQAVRLQAVVGFGC
jgi:hypothetical protein